MASMRNLDLIFDTFDDIFEPRIVQQVNDYGVRIAKCEGIHTWHTDHDVRTTGHVEHRRSGSG